MAWKKKLFWLLALPGAAALVLVASTTSGQTTPQTSPSAGGMMSTPMGGSTMTTPMGGGMMTSPGAGMSTTPYSGGGMERTPESMTGRGARGGAMGAQTHESMMAQMEEANRRLDELVSAMNSATGTAKVDAIAAVVNELAAQHRQMHEHMMSRPGAKGGKRMMGTRGPTSTTPGASTTPRARRRTSGAATTPGSTSPALSPTPMR